jgi:ATP synthase protein I
VSGAMTHEGPEDSGRALERRGVSDAYAALSLVISGVLVWGGVGWLVSEWLDNRVFVMVGLLLGMGAGLYLVWFRYGRAQ